MKPLNLLILLLLILLIASGCKSTAPVAITPHQHLHDEVFPDYGLFRVETEEQVFALDQEAKEFVDRAMKASQNPSEKMEILVERIFDRAELNLLYMGNANTVATDTFHNRAANCLSLSIMTYSLAKYAGFSARFQDVQIPEFWTRREGYSLLNGHINVKISPRQQSNVVQLLGNEMVVDFDPQSTRRHLPTKYLDKPMVLAMFYNNKGADALLSNSFSKAYAYFREAIKTAPHFDSAWVNLGFLYRLMNEYEYAENSYRQAMKIEHENLTAWENLAHLYDLTNRADEAAELRAKVEVQRKTNPFYHYNLGEQEFENSNWEAALIHYRHALKLDKSHHEIYFALAKTYFQLGDVTRSAMYFRKAKSRARSLQQQETYQDKLEMLISSASINI